MRKPVKRHGEDLVVGERGYIWAVDSRDGKLYINGFIEVTMKPEESSTILVERTQAGFLVTCDNMYIWKEDPAKRPTILIPVVGQLTPPTRRAARQAPGTSPN